MQGFCGVVNEEYLEGRLNSTLEGTTILKTLILEPSISLYSETILAYSTSCALFLPKISKAALSYMNTFSRFSKRASLGWLSTDVFVLWLVCGFCVVGCPVGSAGLAVFDVLVC